jgi:hypothetical protein
MFHTVLPKDFCGGFVSWRLTALHYVAKALGLLVHVEGFPYGTCRNLSRERGEDFNMARRGKFTQATPN